MSNLKAFPRHSFTADEIFGPTPLRDASHKLQLSLDGKTSSERIEIARQYLQTNNPETLLAVIKTARVTGSLAGPLVPDLLKLLTCELFVAYTSIRENGVDNAAIAPEAAFAIEQIGVAPDCDALRQLLTDPRRFEIPCSMQYKMAGIVQGPTRDVVPAALAASLLPLLGDEAYDLARFAIQYLNDPEWTVAISVKTAITLLAERARDNPTPAATPMIQALRESKHDFSGPTWIAIRAILASAPTI